MHTSIAISNFTWPAIGLGRTLRFTITYSADSAQKKGQVWQVSLPRLDNPSFFNKYSVSVIAPKDWGIPAQSVPKPVSHLQNFSNQFQKLDYSKSAISDSGISIIFGNVKTYSLSITYAGSSELLLPPDTSYQRINLLSLNPKPYQVLFDGSSNWKALYTDSSSDIQLTGYVNVFNQPLPFPVQLPPAPTQTRTLTGYLVSTQKYSTRSETWNISTHNWTSDQTDYDRVSLAIATQSPPIRKLEITSHEYVDFLDSSSTSTISLPGQLFPLVLDRLDYTVINPVGAAVYNIPLQYTSQGLALSPTFPTTLDILPPFGNINYHFHLTSFPLTDFTPKSFTISLDDNTVTYNIPATSYLMWEICVAIIASSGLLAVGFFAAQAWSVHLQKRSKVNSLRG
jgi:hypothetical protein